MLQNVFNIFSVISIDADGDFQVTEHLTKSKLTRSKTRLHCCVPLCNGDSRYSEDLSFHRFPKEASLRKQWIIKIRRDEGPYFTITSNTRVCSTHFLESDFRPPNKSGKRLLRAGVVPSVFNWRGKMKQRRQMIRMVDSYSRTESEDEADRPEFTADPLEAEPFEVGSSAVTSDAESESLQAAYKAAQREIESLKAQIAALKIHKFGLERFSSDNESIRLYTGFLSYQHFYNFYHFVEPSAQHMNYVYSAGLQANRPSARTMLLIDELFLFLVRIRLCLFEQDLADRFLLSISTVSRKITTWANYLYFLLGTQPVWASRQQINECMPQAFKELYPATRVIIDCTELYVQTPSSLLLQSQLYSSYKSNTTLKGLIGIAPHGAVTFVSSLYTGSISDKEITRCCGLLDLLEENDSVMADKGFDIEDILLKKKVKLNIPPYLQSKGQFSIREATDTKKIAKLRIHVERAIRRVKEYHIFDWCIPLNMMGSINQIYTVVCLLTNFQGALIKKSINNHCELSDD